MLKLTNMFFCSRKKKPAPVIFMGKPTKEECAESGGMSAFGFMSFAMAITNAVINTANNVNSNNNNNNNNNNDNNNNLVNINIANANNAAGNENMATAGRRRRLQQLRSSRNVSDTESEAFANPEGFATAIMVNENGVVYKPLKIGYVGKENLPKVNYKRTAKTGKTYIDKLFENVNHLFGRKRRSISSSKGISDLEGAVSFISLKYISFVTEGLNRPDVMSELQELDSLFQSAGPIERKVSQVLSKKVMQILKYRQ
jgi:hypothetical protein